MAKQSPTGAKLKVAGPREGPEDRVTGAIIVAQLAALRDNFLARREVGVLLRRALKQSYGLQTSLGLRNSRVLVN
jgi:hypothetical protein